MFRHSNYDRKAWMSSNEIVYTYIGLQLCLIFSIDFGVCYVIKYQQHL